MPTYTRPISAHLLASGLGATLGYTVRSAVGGILVARTNAGITEDGTSAIYSVSVASWDASWAGRIVWDAGAGTLAAEDFLGAALASQIPDSFTAATFASPGVFAAPALANAPTGSGGGTAPTAAANATAVRAELTLELGRIDINVGSRLAPATAGRTIALTAAGEVNRNGAQPLAETRAFTVGGAETGAWWFAWGQQRINAAADTLEAYLPSSATVAFATATLDSDTGPTTRGMFI